MKSADIAAALNYSEAAYKAVQAANIDFPTIINSVDLTGANAAALDLKGAAGLYAQQLKTGSLAPSIDLNNYLTARSLDLPNTSLSKSMDSALLKAIRETPKPNKPLG